MKIVMADDDADDRNLFRIAFQIAFSNYTDIPSLEFADNGLELMKCLREKMTNELPDLVFLDLNMPGKSGYEVLKEIKSDPILKKIHVVIFSTSVSESDKIHSEEYGARSYFEKPCDFNDWPDVILNVYQDIKKEIYIQDAHF